jgi:hypothetical protein
MDSAISTPPNPAARNCFSSFPRSYYFSGCNEKSDKVDKSKELQKDDKSNRAPVKDHTLRAQEGSVTSDSSALDVYTTIFA